jgi:uncharacterized membrane protein (DUF106 family)
MDWWTSLQNFIYVVMGAIVGAFVLLIRKVLTNDTEIKLLKAEIKQRNDYREEKDEEFNEQLKEIRADVKRLIRQDTSEYRSNN